MKYTGINEEIEAEQRGLQKYSGEQLRKIDRGASRRFSAELDRAQIGDDRLRYALIAMLAADAEMDRRKGDRP